MDAWDGYRASRDRILAGIIDRRVDDVMALTGDVHANYAADVQGEFRRSRFAHTWQRIRRHLNRHRRERLRNHRWHRQLAGRNPHIKFHNAQRGYVECSVTDQVWKSEYKGVPRVTTANAAISTRASFVVERPGCR